MLRKYRRIELFSSSFPRPVDQAFQIQRDGIKFRVRVAVLLKLADIAIFLMSFESWDSKSSESVPNAVKIS